MKLLKELLFEVEQSKVPEMVRSIQTIFDTIPLKVNVSDHFIERISGRDSGIQEADVVSTMYRVFTKYRSYFDGLKTNRKIKKIVIKNKSKNLNIILEVNCSDPNKIGKLLLITIMKKNINDFHVGQQFVKELIVEGEVPKQTKKAHTKKFKWESRKKQLKDLDKLEKTLDAADAV